MYSRVVHLMKNADMFGADITLNIHQQGKYTSIFGGLMSLLVWVLMLYIFISEGITLVNRTNSQAITRTINDINPSARVLNSTNFMIGLKLEDPLQIIYNTTNYTMFNITIIQTNTATYANKTRNKILNSSITLEKCTASHFQFLDLVSDSNAVETYSDYLCLPLNFSLVLEGTYNSNVFQYTTIKVLACRNSSNCFTDQQLSSLPEKQTFKLSTLIFTTIINPFSNEQIINQQLFQDFYQQTKKLQEYQSDIFLQPNALEIDKSVFPFEQNKFSGEYWSFEIGNVRNFFYDYTEPTNYFTINLRISTSYYSSKISYKQFNDFISYIGGMLKVITSIIGLIVINYNIMGFKLFLANTLYQCKIEDESQAKKKNEQNDIFKFIQQEKEKAEAMLQRFRGSTKKLFQYNKITGVFKQSQRQLIHKSDSDLLKEIHQQPIKEIDSVKMEPQTANEQLSVEHIKEAFIQNMVEQLLIVNQKIQLGINFLIYYLSCLRHFKKFKKTYSVLKKSTKKINKDLDIVLILQKLQEVNKLKQLILNKSQLQLFNYIPSPVITYKLSGAKDRQLALNSLKINACGKVSRYDTRNKFLKLFRAFEIVKQEDKEINTRLIHQLGPLVQNVFHESHQIAQNYNYMKEKSHINRETTYQQNVTLRTSQFQAVKDHNEQMWVRQGAYYIYSKSDLQDYGDVPFDS